MYDGGTGRSRATGANRKNTLTSRVVERMTGIEPACSAWEADVLPLNYIRVPSRGWSTLADLWVSILPRYPRRHAALRP